MQLDAPNQIISKSYSLAPDMMTGWRPKAKVVGPIPLNFDNLVVDQIVQHYIEVGKLHKVVFLGFRPRDTFKMHERLATQYRFKYEHLYQNNYQHLQAFFWKFHSNFKPMVTLPFCGQNPSSDAGLKFDSVFEGGNLDCAIKVREHLYDLFIRIDANTYGHTQWFNFKVHNTRRCKVQFRILNFRKENSPYLRGMKPYVFSQKEFERTGTGWQQAGNSLTYQLKKPAYKCLNDCEIPDYYALTFQFVFPYDGDTVQFSYCVPYDYSRLLEFLGSLEDNANCVQGKLCESLSGLDIPLLTITNFKVPQKGKKCVLVNARTHPGQSNGSWMAEGLIKQLLSNSAEAVFLREKFVFKVVPMLNSDGVVLGNFRTSTPGKDLNRAFNQRIEALYPESKSLRDLAQELRREFKGEFAMFVDLHGHSLKRNVFSYGPEYRIWNNLYYKTRAFPRILYQLSDMFRYFLSIFRISPSKVNTARAVFLKYIPHCYTIEASNCSYFGKIDKLEHFFTTDKWLVMGRQIAQATCKFYDQELKDEPRRKNHTEHRHSVTQRAPQLPDQQLEEGKSDSQNCNQDKNKKQFKNLQRNIINSLNQFNCLFGGAPVHQDRSSQWADSNPDQQLPAPQKPQKPIACLRARSARRNDTQQQKKATVPPRKFSQSLSILKQPFSPSRTNVKFTPYNLQFRTVCKGVELRPKDKKVLPARSRAKSELERPDSRQRVLKLKLVNLVNL